MTLIGQRLFNKLLRDARPLPKVEGHEDGGQQVRMWDNAVLMGRGRGLEAEEVDGLLVELEEFRNGRCR